MKERKIMEMLSDDISDIELPPISDKVLRALHDKAENKSEKSVHHTASAIKHKHSLLKIVFAAMLALFVLSVPIIVVITNKDFVATTSGADSSFDSRDSATNDESSAINSIVNPEKKSSALDNIRERKTYGSVCLTSKSSKELESLLLTNNKDAQVYEDDSFIYNFDSSGNLIELVNKAPVDEKGIAVSEDEIREITMILMSKYYQDWKEDAYKISIQENKDGEPVWIVNLSYKKSNLSLNAFAFMYNRIGVISRVVFLGGGHDIGSISLEEAIRIALKEIRSEKYAIPDFNEDDVNIRVEVKYYDEKPYYQVFFSDICVDDEFRMNVTITIDPENGKVVEIVV